MAPYSLYFHVPFCVHRCAYCDFNTYAGMEKKIPAYVEAICLEIDQIAGSIGKELPVHSIFFGGGTPSLLPEQSLEKIMAALSRSFSILPDCETTLEANPGSVSLDYLQFLHGIGINRLSIGMQSSDENELRWLTRQHKFIDVIRAVAWARQAGFENISLDLIFGLPNQSLATWKNSLQEALRLKPEHLSLYSLIVEPETPLYRWVERGMVEPPDDDGAAEMYEWSMDVLENMDYIQYEISNWAKKTPAGGYIASIHNLQYWLNQPYLGFGAGAHGYAVGVRTANVKGIDAYIQRMRAEMVVDFPRTSANSTVLAVDRETEIGETMMVGLRLTDEGVSNARFYDRFGAAIEDIFPDQIAKLERDGLLEWKSPHKNALRLTRRGRLLGNRVFREFI